MSDKKVMDAFKVLKEYCIDNECCVTCRFHMFQIEDGEKVTCMLSDRIPCLWEENKDAE